MPQFTLGEIDARVLDRLDRNDGLYPTLERYNQINDAIKVVNLLTGFTNSTIGVPGYTVKSQLIYPTPAGIIFPMRVYYEGRQLERVSIRSISMRFRSWTTDRASQGHPVQRWVPLGIGMFAIHPMDTLGGNDIQVNGISEPAVLLNADDFIVIEDQWATLIENLAAQVLQLKESPAIFSSASAIYQEFIRGIKQYIFWQKMVMPRYYLKPNAGEQADQLGDNQ